MQLTQKYIIGIIISGLVLVLGYFAVQNNTPSQSDGVKVNTISQSGIETDTGKRLETVANSGTAWGMSPFGSGKPLTEEEKKPEFKKPNTEWKTRTLSGITYVFGEGNPKKIALNFEQLQEMSKKCVLTSTSETLITSTMSLMNGFCNPENEMLRYVTPEIEKHLLLALSDPSWSKLATECEKNFRAIEQGYYISDAKANNAQNSSWPNLYFDLTFSSGFLDMNNFISIEPNTGWKVLNTGLTISISHFLMQAMLDGQSEGDGHQNPYGDCVDRYGKEIARHFVIATILYMAPLEFSNWVYTGALRSQNSLSPFHFY